MEKDGKAASLNFISFATLILLFSSVSCTPLFIGQAAIEGVEVVATAAASVSAEDHDKGLKSSVTAFNDAFRFEDYAQASGFISQDRKEEFWSEADRFKGKIRLAEYEVREMQLDEKKNHASAVLHCQYWRPDSPILKTVSFTQEWQYFEKEKTWRVSDSGFEAFLSNGY